MRLVFVGDVFGSVGRKALRSLLPVIREEESPDLVVVNGENAAGGAGLTRPLYDEIMACGVDVVTSGNHIFDRRECLAFLDDPSVRAVRPANYPPGAPGRGVVLVTARSGERVAVANLVGRFNLVDVDCPFRAADDLLRELDGGVDLVVVDFHAETTSEKVALGWYLDGRVAAVIGTHTHVPTADARVLPGGTAYVTDAGMTGAMDSVIGLEREAMIRRFVSGLPIKFHGATENPGLDYVVADLDGGGRARGIRVARRFVRR